MKILLYSNKKAFHDFFIEEKYEAGIVLNGSEVKSCMYGNVSLSDAYVTIDNGELIMYNSFIAQYNHSGYIKHEEKCKRKLLMHKKEILKLNQEINVKGFTLIPISFYINNGKIKVEIALAKGKKNYDKRNSLKEKDVKKEIKRYL